MLASVPLVRESGKPVKANLSIDSGVLAVLDEEARARDLTQLRHGGTHGEDHAPGNGLSKRSAETGSDDEVESWTVAL